MRQSRRLGKNVITHWQRRGFEKLQPFSTADFGLFLKNRIALSNNVIDMKFGLVVVLCILFKKKKKLMLYLFWFFFFNFLILTCFWPFKRIWRSLNGHGRKRPMRKKIKKKNYESHIDNFGIEMKCTHRSNYWVGLRLGSAWALL